MKTNDLKKGTKIMLKCGWCGELVDNMRGNTRMALVHGFCSEIGSIYSHDIVAYQKDGVWHHDIEYTPSQIKLRDMVGHFM